MTPSRQFQPPKIILNPFELDAFVGIFVLDKPFKSFDYALDSFVRITIMFNCVNIR
jgi:hypothetical protein